MCIEDRHGFAEELIKLGFDVERHNHLAVPSGTTEHITRELLNRHIQFMYVDIPTSVKLGNREAGYWQRVAVWIKIQQAVGHHVCGHRNVGKEVEASSSSELS